MDILESTPFEIYRYLDSSFSDEAWLTWEPETLVRMLDKSMKDDLSKDKVLAIQALAGNALLSTTDNRAFEKIVHAFCHNHCVMDVTQPPQIEEIYWSLPYIIDIILASQEDLAAKDIVFTGEIPGYVAGVGKYHGWIVLPKSLDFAREMLDNLNGIRGWDTKDSDIRAVVEQARTISEQLDSVTPDTKGLDALLEDTPRNIMIRKLVGCTLYKPY